VSERPMAVPRSRLPTASAPRQEGPAGSRASADDAAAARGYGPHDGLQR
jgi:hypothetical protein